MTCSLPLCVIHIVVSRPSQTEVFTVVYDHVLPLRPTITEEEKRLLRIMNCCINCHFFVKKAGLPNRQGAYRYTPLTEKDRSELWSDNVRPQLQCFKGIWTEQRIRELTPKSKLRARLEETLSQDRKENCFYIEHFEGMSPEGGNELFRLRNDNRQLKTSYRYTQMGLWIAALGATFAGLDNFVEYGSKLVNWIVSLWS